MLHLNFSISYSNGIFFNGSCSNLYGFLLVSLFWFFESLIVKRSRTKFLIQLIDLIALLIFLSSTLLSHAKLPLFNIVSLIILLYLIVKLSTQTSTILCRILSKKIVVRCETNFIELLIIIVSAYVVLLYITCTLTILQIFSIPSTLSLAISVCFIYFFLNSFLQKNGDNSHPHNICVRPIGRLINQKNPVEVALILVYVFLFIMKIMLLFHARTPEEVVVIWNIVDPIFAYLTVASTVVLAFIIFWYFRNDSLADGKTLIVFLVFLVFLEVLSSSTIIPIVYGSLYGGDQLYNAAAVKTLLANNIGSSTFISSPLSEEIRYLFFRSQIILTHLLTGVSVIDIMVWLYPIFWPFFFSASLLLLGSMLFKDPRIVFLLPLSSRIFYFINIFSAQTHPLTLGMMHALYLMLILKAFHHERLSIRDFEQIIFLFIPFFSSYLVYQTIFFIFLPFLVFLIRQPVNLLRGNLKAEFFDVKDIIASIIIFWIGTFLVFSIQISDFINIIQNYSLLILQKVLSLDYFAKIFLSAYDPFYKAVIYKETIEKVKFPFEDFDLHIFVLHIILIVSLIVLMKKRKFLRIIGYVLFCAFTSQNIVFPYIGDKASFAGFHLVRLTPFYQLQLLLVLGFLLDSALNNTSIKLRIKFGRKAINVSLIFIFIILLILLGSTRIILLNPNSSNIDKRNMDVISHLHILHPQGDIVVFSEQRNVYYYMYLINNVSYIEIFPLDENRARTIFVYYNRFISTRDTAVVRSFYESVSQNNSKTVYLVVNNNLENYLTYRSDVIFEKVYGNDLSSAYRVSVFTDLFNGDEFTDNEIHNNWQINDDGRIQEFTAKFSNGNLELTGRSGDGSTVYGWITSRGKIIIDNAIIDIHIGLPDNASFNRLELRFYITKDNAKSPLKRNDWLRVMLGAIKNGFGIEVAQKVNETVDTLHSYSLVKYAEGTFRMKFKSLGKGFYLVHIYYHEGQGEVDESRDELSNSPFTVGLDFTEGYVGYEFSTSEVVTYTVRSDYVRSSYIP